MMTTQTPGATVHQSILIFMKSDSLAQSIKKALESSSLSGVIVNNEAAAFAEMKTSTPSLIIIDRQQSATNNFRQLRALSAVPIVAVESVAKSCADDECLQDYERDVDLVICSPSPRELVARVRAILRRQQPQAATGRYYSVGALRMDLDRHEVSVNGRLVDLTPKEFQILRQFMESPSRVFSRQEMLNRVWGEGYALEEHALDVHIHSIRHKIELAPASPRSIVTVRGIGYKLRST